MEVISYAHQDKYIVFLRAAGGTEVFIYTRKSSSPIGG